MRNSHLTALAFAELQATVLASPKFLAWRPTRSPKSKLDFTGDTFIDIGGSWHGGPEPKPKPVAMEQHFTPAELSALWGVSGDTVRRLFADEPDILRVSESNPRRRRYVSIRIPESAAIRLHKKLTAVI
ncbi:MAG: hypothetical protein ACRDHZ_16185 [Ktedonobacteraceae bacterium]